MEVSEVSVSLNADPLVTGRTVHPFSLDPPIVFWRDQGFFPHVELSLYFGAIS